MGTIVYDNRIIVFESKAVDALKAATAISGPACVHITVFDDVVMVTFNSNVEELMMHRTVDDLIRRTVSILKKYNIEYKVKEMKF